MMIGDTMVITEDALNRVDQHWAVKAVGDDRLARALEVAKVRTVRSAAEHQTAIVFDETGTDSELVKLVAAAYEIAAIEGLDALLHPSGDEASVQLRLQARAGAYRAYALRRTLPIPKGPEDLIFHVLHLAALACCGDQWTDLRRWLKEHEREVKPPSVEDATWDNRVLHRLFDCWVRLLRTQGGDDLDGVRGIIADLRKDQEQYESGFLAEFDNAAAKAAAFRLIALYHWAKATELLAIYMVPAGIEAELDKHFEAGRKAASAAQDAALEVILRWLHATSHLMVAGSLK